MLENRIKDSLPSNETCRGSVGKAYRKQSCPSEERLYELSRHIWNVSLFFKKKIFIFEGEREQEKASGGGAEIEDRGSKMDSVATVESPMWDSNLGTPRS